MASLADLLSSFAPKQPVAPVLANIRLQGQHAKTNAGIARQRLLRNFNQFDLPDLLSSQAARGAFASSATENKRTKLATGVGDELSDVALGLAQTQAQLAANALLAKSGISLGGL